MLRAALASPEIQSNFDALGRAGLGRSGRSHSVIQHSGLAIVRMPARTQVADRPHAYIPKDCVDKEVASERDASQQSWPSRQRTTLRIESGDEPFARDGNDAGGSGPQRTARKIDSHFKNDDRSGDSQKNRPKSSRFEHGPLHMKKYWKRAGRLGLVRGDSSGEATLHSIQRDGDRELGRCCGASEVY